MKTLIIIGMVTLLSSSTGFGRGGFRGGGGRMGARSVSRTTIRPGAGINYSRTAVSRYHNYRGGVTVPGRYPGYVPRTVGRVANRMAYRTAIGRSYYYGTPVYSVPGSCSTVYWEGMMVQDCGGVRYVYQNSAYYPIEYQ